MLVNFKNTYQCFSYNYRTVVCPFVDVIDYETFEYRAQDNGGRGAWDWELYYKRLPLLPEDKKDPTKPFRSPVMAGGYFAISSKWYAKAWLNFIPYCSRLTLQS